MKSLLLTPRLLFRLRWNSLLEKRIYFSPNRWMVDYNLPLITKKHFREIIMLFIKFVRGFISYISLPDRLAFMEKSGIVTTDFTPCLPVPMVEEIDGYEFPFTDAESFAIVVHNVYGIQSQLTLAFEAIDPAHQQVTELLVRDHFQGLKEKYPSYSDFVQDLGAEPENTRFSIFDLDQFSGFVQGSTPEEDRKWDATEQNILDLIEKQLNQ